MIIQNNQTKGGIQRLSLFIFFSSAIALFLSFNQVDKKIQSQIFEYGKASYYGHPFIGRKTASGEIFTESEYTCAHKTLPFGTKLKITNTSNNQSIIVRVNDRGPFCKNRVVDLSIRGAKDLGLIQSGIASVTVEIVNSNFSSLGNTKNMEKIPVDNGFAYISFDDNEKYNKLFQYLSSTDQLDNVENIKEVDPKDYVQPSSNDKLPTQGTKEEPKPLVQGN